MHFSFSKNSWSCLGHFSKHAFQTPPVTRLLWTLSCCYQNSDRNYSGAHRIIFLLQTDDGICPCQPSVASHPSQAHFVVKQFQAVRDASRDHSFPPLHFRRGLRQSPSLPLPAGHSRFPTRADLGSKETLLPQPPAPVSAGPRVIGQGVQAQDLPQPDGNWRSKKQPRCLKYRLDFIDLPKIRRITPPPRGYEGAARKHAGWKAETPTCTLLPPCSVFSLHYCPLKNSSIASLLAKGQPAHCPMHPSCVSGYHFMSSPACSCQHRTVPRWRASALAGCCTFSCE